jgi:hypothetical protein
MFKSMFAKSRSYSLICLACYSHIFLFYPCSTAQLKVVPITAQRQTTSVKVQSDYVTSQKVVQPVLDVRLITNHVLTPAPGT